MPAEDILNDIDAFVLDAFGTITDWHGTVAREVKARAALSITDAGTRAIHICICTPTGDWRRAGSDMRGRTRIAGVHRRMAARLHGTHVRPRPQIAHMHMRGCSAGMLTTCRSFPARVSPEAATGPSARTCFTERCAKRPEVAYLS